MCLHTCPHLCVYAFAYVDIDRLTSQLLLGRMRNERILLAFSFSRFVNFDVSSLDSTRLTLSLNFIKEIVDLADLLVAYKPVTADVFNVV